MKQINEYKNVWEYVDWLYLSGRLTAEEFNTLKLFLVQFEDETAISALKYQNEGC